MDFPQYSVLFMEEDSAIPAGSRPLMLEPVLSCPILKWMSGQLLDEGVQRFFVVCSPRFEEAAKVCFPEGTDVTFSEQHAELMAFLNTPDSVLVLPRAAFPMKGAGLGFAYAAPGYELQEAWRQKMTNSVQAAELVPGWLPVYGQSTVAELELLLREKNNK